MLRHGNPIERLKIYIGSVSRVDTNPSNILFVQAREQTHHWIRGYSLTKGCPNESYTNGSKQAIPPCTIVLLLPCQDTYHAPRGLVETDTTRTLNKPFIQVLSAKAQRNNYNIFPNFEDRIPWKWDFVRRRFDHL